MSGGLLNYGREYMPGQDTRSGMEQLRGLLGAAPDVYGGAAHTVGRYARDNPLEAAALLTSPIPVVGDAMGLLSDAKMYAADPESRTAGNMAMSALGALPFVPHMPIGEAGGLLGAIKAYHGSPHVFDRFSMDKIGTGEGAQAYGRGLYFAESPEVAKGYQRNLSSMQRHIKIERDGAPFEPKTKSEILAANAIIDSKGVQGDIDQWFQDSYSMLQGPYASFTKDELDAAKTISQSLQAKRDGALYTTTLDVEPEDLFDWDKPLSEQPPKIQDAVNRVARDIEPYGLDRVTDDMRGIEMKKMLNSPEAVSKLNALGVKGIRYLDGGSRGAGQGTSNYVIFDDKLVRIDERNGQPLGLLESAR